MNTDNLSLTISELLQSGTQSNQALNQLLNDYSRYHFALSVIASLFLVGFIVLGLFFWKRFKNISKDSLDTKIFEKRVYVTFLLVCVFVGSLLLLLIAGNVSNAIHPRQGLAGTVAMLQVTPSSSQEKIALYKSVATWLHSDNSELPVPLQDKINDRLAWQGPKAIVCTLLLGLGLFANLIIWRAIIRHSRVCRMRRAYKVWPLLILGIIMVMICLGLMLMIMGNAQAVFAPIVLTILFG